MGEGNGREVGVDYIALGQVREDLHEERTNIGQVKAAMTPPAAGMFGSSADGQYLYNLVTEGHAAIRRAMEESETALTKMDQGIEAAVKELEGADAEAEAAAVVLQMFVEATKIMSNPLVLFSKETLAKRGNIPI